MAGFSLFAQKAEWKEMHAFHSIMSNTFHSAEEGNLKPLKNNAADLLKAAKAWQLSTVPAGYNSAVTNPILKTLTEKCNTLNEAVKNKQPDDKLKQLITEAHNIFHEIMEKCKAS